MARQEHHASARIAGESANDMSIAASQSTTIRLGTRGSLLARTQSQLVADALQEAHPGWRVELKIVKTTGDQILDRPLHDIGGKGLFTRELEQALLHGDIDFAVHSFKDVPTTMPLVAQENLIVAAVPARADPRDVLISRVAITIDELPQGARIGTGSLRRRCQLLDRRPDLLIEPIRGNVDTRLRKLREGAMDAVILAFAGLKRANLFDPSIMNVIPDDLLLPAPGQGALALQCRRDDSRTRALLMSLNDEFTALCVRAERALVGNLRGDCLSPIAALATIESGRLRLRGTIGARHGAPPVLRASAEENLDDPESVARDLFEQLEKSGVMNLLHGQDSTECATNSEVPKRSPSSGTPEEPRTK